MTYRDAWLVWNWWRWWSREGGCFEEANFELILLKEAGVNRRWKVAAPQLVPLSILHLDRAHHHHQPTLK